MNTKAVYVVTSTDSDSFLEQLIISAYSMKYWNPDIYITVVTDKETEFGLIGNRKLIYSYIDELISISIPSEFSRMQRSRYLKTTLRKVVSGDFFYLDTDTVVAGNLDELDSFDFDLGAIPDKHMPIHKHTGEDHIRKYADIMDWKIPENDLYFNGGVMYAKDSETSHKFYRLWHELWIDCVRNKNMSIDQPSLAKANAMTGYPLVELDGIYNCQIIENGLKYLYNAKIIHYFASNIGKWDCPYIFRDDAIYQTVKEQGITDEIKDLVANAKSAFNEKTLILAGNMCNSYNSVINGIARRIYTKLPRLSSFLDHLYFKYLQK